MKKLLILLFCPFAITGYTQSIPTDSLYLGQTPPGNTSVVFAPKKISKTASYEHDITFSPDGKEMFYCISKPNWSEFKIYRAYWSTDHWTTPVLADFSNQYNNTEICYSPDGQSLLFASSRAPGAAPWNFAIFKLTKNAGNWSTPTEIGIKALQPAGNDGNWHPSITSDSIVYFSSYSSTAYDIYYSKLKNGVASNFVKMGNGINSSVNDWYPWIAPDNSYLLFCSERAGGFGGSDLYISFRKKDNTWTTPKNLGNTVNSSGIESSPRVTPDGKYLFFTRTINWDGDFYWVSTNIIDEIKRQTPEVTSAKSIIKQRVHKIEIYPNPSTGVFNIHIDDVAVKNAVVEIYDFIGKRVHSKESVNGAIDLTGYQKGIYVAKFSLGDKVLTEKIVIN